MFRKIVKYFGPEWGAAVMGTAALSITMQLSSEVARPFSPLLYVGVGFYLLAIIMFVAFLIPWTLRFFWYPSEVRKDLLNPIRGNFFPTMPISVILAGTGTNKLGPLLFGPTIAYSLALVFFFVGAAGIFVFGYLLVRNQFLNDDLRLEHANFAWFIPPVSHLIIPVLGVCSMDVHWAETPVAPWLYTISMVALGAGFFNFLFVGAAVWHRYVYASIPVGRLAATTMVAIAPTAILVVFLMKGAEAVEAGHGRLFGLEFATLFPVIKVAASALWGFSAWWFVVAVILFVYYLRRGDHGVAFAWWAYTFPFEAFIVATGLLSKAVATEILHPLLIGLNGLAVVVWIVVVFGTLQWLQSGAFFEVEHPEMRRLTPRFVLMGVATVLIPFLLGPVLLPIISGRPVFAAAPRGNDAAAPSERCMQNGVELEWTFFPDWQYKPLLFPADHYLVFVFHYTNDSDFPVYVTPTYTLTCAPRIRHAANEEIAAYIEDAVEDELHLTEETPMTFQVPAHATKHDIATFEKPPAVTAFDVDVEVFDGRSWQLHYEQHGQTWVNSANREVVKYGGRG
jgi:C4-dicarboxylate transporter/malic acid transport protein